MMMMQKEKLSELLTCAMIGTKWQKPKVVMHHEQRLLMDPKPLAQRQRFDEESIQNQSPSN